MGSLDASDFIKKHKTLPIVFVLVVALCCWWAYANFMPHPLGGRMEYLGKEDLGNILGFDEAPYSVYYYGTDMEPKEIVKYFKDTTLKHPIEDKGQYTDVWLTYKGKTASITYVQGAPANIKKTNKKYLISVLDKDYTILQSIPVQIEAH